MRPARSRTFWIVGFVFVFLVHALAILHYGEHGKFEIPLTKPEPYLYIGGDAATDERLAELTGWPDPTFFALPHPEGFSGGAWLKFQPEMPPLTNWSAPPEWLPLAAEQLGRTLGEYIATNPLPDEPRLAAFRAPRTLDVRLPGQIVRSNTTSRVEGLLAGRQLLRAPELPAARYNDVLRNSAVAVVVNGDGLVESAALAAPSGSPEADRRAVELARGFEFQRLPLTETRARELAPPIIGRIVFAWQVLPPTNGIPAATSLP